MIPYRPIEWLQLTRRPSCQPLPGCVASRIQPVQTSTGRNPSRKTPTDSRGQPHYVQPPTICESASTNPAPATIPIDAQNRPVVCCPTSVATQTRNPDTPAASAVTRPRLKSYVRIRHLIPFGSVALNG